MMPPTFSPSLESPAPYFLLVSGGTGGHIAPAASVATRIANTPFLTIGNTVSPAQAAQTARVVFLTLPKNIDYPDIKAMQNEKNISIVSYPAPPLPSGAKALLQIFSFLSGLAASFGAVRMLVREQGRPLGVVAFGGYPGFPALLWALLHRVPIFLHEQNAMPGFVTRLFQKHAHTVFYSFPLDSPVDSKMNAKLDSTNGNRPTIAAATGRAVFTGNPLRPLFLETKPAKARDKRTKSGSLKILMTGGSQGARDINRLYQAMVADGRFQKHRFTLACGPANSEDPDLQKSLRKSDTLTPFILNMPDELQKADLVIARAGSGTIYEIVWAKRPCVLLPYPYAKDNHQFYNARALQKYGICEIIDWKSGQPERLPGALDRLDQWINSGGYDDAISATKSRLLPLDADRQITDYLLGVCSK